MKKKQFTRHLCILINPEVFDRMKQITDQQEISISQYLRSAIKEKLEREDEQEEAIEGEKLAQETDQNTVN